MLKFVLIAALAVAPMCAQQISLPQVRSGLTQGSIVFQGPSANRLTQDNSNFYWDVVNHRLGIRKSAPTHGAFWLGPGLLEGYGMSATGLDTPTMGVFADGSLASPNTSTYPGFTFARINNSVYTSGLGNYIFYGLKTGPAGGQPAGNAMENVTISTRQSGRPGDLAGLYNRVVMSEGTATTIANRGTGWAYVGSCQKLTQYDKCSVMELNPDNQSGVDAPPDYASDGLMNGLAIVAYGTAKNSQAMFIESGAGAASAFQNGIDFTNASVTPGGNAIILPNNRSIAARDTTTGKVDLLHRNAGNDTVLNATGGFLYFAINGTVQAWIDNAGHYHPPSKTFGLLGAPADGAQDYCPDCGVSAGNCASGGTGAMAFRLNGAWRCTQ